MYIQLQYNYVQPSKAGLIGQFELLAQELEVPCFRACSKMDEKKTIHVQLSRRTWTLEACTGQYILVVITFPWRLQ